MCGSGSAADGLQTLTRGTIFLTVLAAVVFVIDFSFLLSRISDAIADPFGHPPPVVVEFDAIFIGSFTAALLVPIFLLWHSWRDLSAPPKTTGHRGSVVMPITGAGVEITANKQITSQQMIGQQTPITR